MCIRLGVAWPMGHMGAMGAMKFGSGVESNKFGAQDDQDISRCSNTQHFQQPLEVFFRLAYHQGLANGRSTPWVGQWPVNSLDYSNGLLLNIAIETVDLPIKNGDVPSFFVCLLEGT